MFNFINTNGSINDKLTGIVCMLSSKESIQAGMKANDRTLTQHAQIPGLFPSIRKERYGRGEKIKPQFYMDGGI